MSSGATVHLTKLAAAQRQLDATIRMSLSGEDDLAIHTIAAAAYRILRDLKGKRGHSELIDLHFRGVFYIARDLANGKLKGLPPEVRASEVLANIIVSTAEAIAAGHIKSWRDMNITTDSHSEQLYWRKFNRPSNFLKHADKDIGDALAFDELNNDKLLLSAIAAYIDLVGTHTSEMFVYHVYRFVNEPDFTLLSTETASRLRCLEDDVRRQVCVEILSDLKARPRALGTSSYAEKGHSVRPEDPA